MRDSMDHSQKLKVLHILNELRFSGAEVLLSSGSPILANKVAGHVLSTGKIEGTYAKDLKECGYAIHHRPFRRSPQFFIDIFKLIRANKIDVVHIHSERASFAYALTALLAGAHCVRTVHNVFTFKAPLRTIRSVERQLLNSLGCVQVSCSPAVQQNELKQLKSETILINNWFSAERVTKITEATRAEARLHAQIPGTAFTLVSVGNDDPAKNLLEIIDAVDGEENNNYLYIHCGANQNISSRAEIRHKDRIRFNGPTSNISPFLTGSDAFVCASLFEGGQLSLLEAAASGCYCITTRVGLASAFSGQPNIDFIEPNSHSLREALKRAQEVPLHKRIAQGKILARYTAENFGVSNGPSAYLALYQRVAK